MVAEMNKKASFGVFIADSSPWPKGQERVGCFRFCLHLLKGIYIYIPFNRCKKKPIYIYIGFVYIYILYICNIYICICFFLRERKVKVEVS